MLRLLKKLLSVMTFALVVASCAGGAPTNTATPPPAASAALAPTETPLPVATSTLTSTPAPTASATVTLTPTPHPAQVFAEPILEFIADREPDYQDDFSTYGGWENARMKEEYCCHGLAQYVEGEYVVIADPVNAEQQKNDDFNFAWGNNYKIIPTLSNFVIEIEQHWVKSTGLDALFLCYQQDCFDFRIWTDRRLDFWGESIFPDLPRQEYLTDLVLPQIKSLSQVTSLMMIKKGAEIALYINHAPVYYLAAPENRSRKINSIQLRVGNASAATPAEVHWDNLKVWVLNP